MGDIRLGTAYPEFKVGASDCTIYLGTVKLYPRVLSAKWVATYSDSSVSSAACDASSGIVQNEIDTTNLVSVEIGSCVTSIGNSAFANCTSLTSVTIGSGVTSINGYAFNYCSGLTSVNIGSGVTSINNGVFQYCYSLTSITIPDSVTSIGVSVFNYCSGLTSVNIGSGVTSIDRQAFDACTNLTSVTCNATTPPTLGYNVFRNTGNCPIYVPSDSVNAYKTATRWSDYASRIQAIP